MSAEDGTPWRWTVVAGVGGGVVLNLVMLLTFRVVGFGWDGGGILLDPGLQSDKLIAVWTEIPPLPRVVADPLPIVLGLVVFGVLHAFVYRSVSPAWPSGVAARGTRFSLLLFAVAYLFWEFFTPYNLFREPLPLIGLELLFWLVIAVAEGYTIAFLHERWVGGA